MQDFPHHYASRASARPDGDLTAESAGLPSLAIASPAAFDGPGDRWSPETLLVAAVANCFILTFRAIARFSKLSWTSLTCDVTGTLDRVDRVTQFTAFTVRASLDVPDSVTEEQATRALTKAEQTCLITNSLKAPCHFEANVHVVHRAAA